jgi:hypothetical protein
LATLSVAIVPAAIMRHTKRQGTRSLNHIQYMPQGHITGTVSLGFRPSVFFVEWYPWGPDSWATALNIDSNSRRNLIRFDYKNRLRAMPLNGESRLRAMPHCGVSRLCAMPHSACRDSALCHITRSLTPCDAAKRGVNIFSRIRNHMQKYFNPLISDPSGIDS